MKGFKITLDNEAKNMIEWHGKRAFPNECCGFLFGKDGADNRRATMAFPVTNKKEGDQRRRFEISPFDYMKAEQFALEQGLQLIGIYHSHPNHPAIASEHDLAMAMPYFSYVIVSVMNGEVADLKSWKLADSDEKVFKEETVYIQHESLATI